MAKQVTGTVLSAKSEKTIVVGVEMTKVHPLYKKRMRRLKKLYAHDEDGVATEGDTVIITECRPRSKQKQWELVEVVKE